MPYSNTITLLDTEGGPQTAEVTARLWMLWGTYGDGSEFHQDEQDKADITVRRDSSSAGPFTFGRNGTFADLSREVGLSVQDTTRVGNDTGWLFRSGRIHDSLPTSPIEIITANQTITAAQVPGLLPALPFDNGDGTIITSMSTTLAAASTSPVMPAGIDFSASGTTNKVLTGVGFTYTGRLLLSPSTFVGLAQIEAVTVGIDNPSIRFFPIGAADPLAASISIPGSTATAFVLNILKPVVMKEFAPTIRRQIEGMINTSAIASVGRSLPGGVLPAGVTLSIRSISVTTASIVIRGAVGAFGGVVAKLPSSGGGGTGSPLKCSYTSLALAGYALTGFALLRHVRDTRLSTSDAGRKLTELYYRCGPEVIRLLKADRVLAARAAVAANELTDLMRGTQPIPVGHRRRYEGMLRELAARGSNDLRAAVEYTLNADVWSLLRGNPVHP